MSNDSKDLSRRDLWDQGTQALFRGAAEAAKQQAMAAHDPQMALMIATVFPIAAFAVSRGMQFLLAPRVSPFARGFGKAFESDPGKVEAHAQEIEGDPNRQEVMYRAFRAMLDAADPSVVESLGYLAGAYSRSGKRPDAFFRGVGRLLADLEADEFDALRALLKGIRMVNVDDDDDWLDVVLDVQKVEGSEKTTAGPRGALTTTWEREPIVRIVHTPNSCTDVGKFPAVARLFPLLKREGLAENMPDVDDLEGRRFPLGDLAMYISVRTIGAILAVIEP